MIALKNKTAVITGAAGGIGGATARLFYELGANVVLTDLEGAPVTEAARQLDPSGARVLALAHDVSDLGSCERVVAETFKQFGGLDCLVNNAGVYRSSPLDSSTADEWRTTMSINLDGMFYMIRSAVPRMTDGGAIVNISSVTALRGAYPGYAAYAASKGAILSYTRSLAIELAPRRIRVNAVAPGPTHTPLIQDFYDANADRLLAMIPLGRLAEPQDIARAIAFLCSDWASYIHGATLHVNGGMHFAG